MKTFTSLTAGLATVAVLAGAALAQAPKPATPQAAPAPAPAAQVPAKAAVTKDITGEFVSADKATKSVIVKHVVDQKAVQMTVSVDDAMLAAVTQFKAGDKVKVTYEEVSGKFVGKAITKT
jgi:Cu/Ag efflux protein CusF